MQDVADKKQIACSMISELALKNKECDRLPGSEIQKSNIMLRCFGLPDYRKCRMRHYYHSSFEVYNNKLVKPNKFQEEINVSDKRY